MGRRIQAALILIGLGMWLSPHQGLARTPAVERILQPVLSNYEVIRMEPSDIETQARQSSEPLELNLSGVRYYFELVPRDLRSPRYRSEVTGEDGVRQQLPPPVTTYRGTALVGQEVVQARFTITGDSFEGVVFTPGDWHYIEPLGNYLQSAEAAELVVYKHSDIKPGQEWRCGASNLKRGINQVDQAAVQAARNTTTTYTTEVATDADYEYVQALGGPDAAKREIMSIMNMVEGVYEQELNLKLEIVFQHAWNRRNDPYTGTNGSDLLEQFREHWNGNFSAKGYDLAHLWTGRETLKREGEDGEEVDVAGQAYLAEVCKRLYDSYSYGYSKLTALRSNNVLITTHEIGHSFGAVHPDEEEPPVTSCRGTVMSGSLDPPRSLTFCQFSRNEIRDHVSTYNSCLEAETETITVNPPSNLTAEPIGSSQIRLTWRDNSTNELTFTIARRAPGKDWDVLVLLPPNRTEFVDAGLFPASTFSYQVFAVAEGSDGEPVYGESNIVTATTLHSDPGGGKPDLTRWVIPTMANSPGRHGAYYRTKVILSNFDSDLDLTIRLYGPGGAVAWRHRSIEANYYRTWNNFLEEVFDYRGTGAVEFSGNAPFTVSAEVYTTSSNGTYTTVVHNGPAPLTPYLSLAASVGVVTVDGATRTNAGVFNNSNRSQTVTARVYYPDSDSEDPDQTLTFSLPPKGWAQKTVTARGERGYIFWRIPREAYLWVVSVDNRSNDGTLAVPTPLE